MLDFFVLLCQCCYLLLKEFLIWFQCFDFIINFSSNFCKISTSPKTYWSKLKTFLNNKKIFYWQIFVYNKYITNFKQKAEIFNSHFSKQYLPLINNSKIPSECPRKSNESLSSITLEIIDIEKKLKTLTQTNLMATIYSVFAYSNCVVNPFTNLWTLFLNLV